MKSTSWDTPRVNPSPAGNLFDDLIETASEGARGHITRRAGTDALVEVISKKGTRVVRSALAGMRARRAAGREVNPLSLIDYYRQVDTRRNVEVPAESVVFVILTGWPVFTALSMGGRVVQGKVRPDGTADWSLVGFPEVENPMELAEKTVALAWKLRDDSASASRPSGGSSEDLLGEISPVDLAKFIHSTPGFEKYPLPWLLPRLKAMVALRANQAESDALPV